MKVNCEFCGRECNKSPYRIKLAKDNGWNLLCSRKCRIDNRTTKIEIKCANCDKEIIRNICDIKYYKKLYCSHKCSSLNKITSVYVECGWCGKNIIKSQYQINHNKIGKLFCDNKCSGFYCSQNRTSFYNRSWLERYIESELILKYSNLDFLFNSRLIENKELDIYIPSLSLAFEINGKGHYEQIYSEESFNRTQINDNLKIKLCKDMNIKLYIINTQYHKHPTINNSQIYLNEITSMIDRYI